MTGREGDLFRVEFDSTRTVLEWLERYGEIPLPPYIDRSAEADDDARYQTVYANNPGAVAAPTAGLHFDETMLATLRAQGVETAFVALHVGAGTFQPVRAETLAEHVMHSERYAIPETTVAAIRQTQARGGRVCAVRAPVCARWNRPPVRAHCWPAKAKPICSSPQATASRWWNVWSPTSIYPNPPC